MDLVGSNWMGVIDELVDSAESELLLVSPYVTAQPLARVVERLRTRVVQDVISVRMVTNITTPSILAESVDVCAVLDLTHRVGRTTVVSLPGLHAKVYVADHRLAAVTSANLTTGGMFANREYGVVLREPCAASQVRTDMSRLASFGFGVSDDRLSAFAEAARELKDEHRRAQKSRTRQAIRQFEELEQRFATALMSARAEGRSTHGMFEQAVLHVLARGPRRTAQLHPAIQQLLPDLCDDSIDRVIDGVRFGKRWKHYVRNAQQALKRRGAVRLDGELWRAADSEAQ